MSYTQHEWTTGETITAAKLNNIEEGISEAAQSGGGYDAILKVYHENNSGGGYEFTIVSGTFADLVAKCEESVPPTILVQYWNDFTGTITATTAVIVYYLGAGYSTPFITFYAYPPKNENTVEAFYFRWTAEDEVNDN